ncbi:MAG TPA: DUF3443 domain-containing protein [Bryobacteraceae bacterium]|nr:DUF3443 domain-containing protein [Bryobacteraceae bacterium]
MSVPEAKVTGLRARQVCALLAGGMVLLATSGCGAGSSSGSNSGTPGGTTPTPPTAVNNTLSIQAGSGATNQFFNLLLTSVTACVPGTGNCQTIPNVLVDTGSTGLRLLSASLTITLPAVSDSAGNPLGNCIGFAGNTYAWGPVATADVQLAGETASKVPIQIINASGFPAAPEACSAGGANTDASSLGANGILGIGVTQQDCGSACATSLGGVPAVYFGCPSSGCVAEAVSLQQQLQNPVGLFPQDNNGVVINLPALDAGGDPSASGSLVFGIGTQTNNALAGVQIYTTDQVGNFTVTFNGSSYSESFLDTGSNGYFFLNANSLGVPTCPVNTDFYCPAATMNYSAITSGTNGTQNTIVFSIANANTLFNTGNNVFNDVGGPNVGGFDLGLPFFFGRTVYVAIEGASASGFTGPYYAF